MNIKNLFQLILILLCTAFISSCHSDEPQGDELVERLQGTWVAEKCTVDAFGETVKISIEELKDYIGADKYIDGEITIEGMKINGISYSVKDNSILLPWFNDWVSVSFSGSKMTWYYCRHIENEKIEVWIDYNKAAS